MSKLIDITGQRFGRLLVIDRYFNDASVKTVWRCICDCGNTVYTAGNHLREGKTKSCGCFRLDFLKSRSGTSAANWKGGKKLHQGYVYIRCVEHPAANKGYVFEHRLVMERALGRYLHPDETIHHKNGIRDDNRPENLELRASNHGKGQTVEDLVTWAKEILQRYGSS